MISCMESVRDVQPEIESALAYAGGTHTYEDVVQMVDDGRAQFWPGITSCIVTEVVDFPRKRLLNVFLAAGNLAELERMLPHVLAWGTTQGCQAATFTGRKGWEKSFLMRQGWSAPLTFFTRDLSDV